MKEQRRFEVKVRRQKGLSKQFSKMIKEAPEEV